MSYERLLDATQDLIKIQSTPDRPEDLWKAYGFMRQFVNDTAAEYGANLSIEDFESNGKPSFLAYHGRVRPDSFPVLLNGHIDVVPGAPQQFEPSVRDGKLYGRGVYDMKAATIVMADIFCKYPGAALQVTADEETGGEHGAAYQINEHGVRSKFTICGEAGRSDEREIANESKGVAVVDVDLIGKTGHGAYPLQGVNALDMGVDFIMDLRERFPKPADTTEQNRVTTASRLRFNTTNDGLTQTPGLATVRLDFRYILGEPGFENGAALTALIKTIDPAAKVAKFHVWGEPMYTPPDYPMLQLLKTAAEEVEGGTFNLVRRNGTSDGRHFSPVGGQACEFGIAGYDHHGPEEYITLTAFKNYYQTLDRFLQKAAETGAIEQ